MDMYSIVGDLLSLQYGGSETHKKMGSTQQASTRKKQVATAQLNDLAAMTKHKELLTSIRRYYSNAFTDRLKQDAMNVFLGMYRPTKMHYGHLPLWEMESDFYLHNFRVQNGSILTMKARRDTWLSSSDEENVGERGSILDAGSSKSGKILTSKRDRVARRCLRQNEVTALRVIYCANAQLNAPAGVVG